MKLKNNYVLVFQIPFVKIGVSIRIDGWDERPYFFEHENRAYYHEFYFGYKNLEIMISKGKYWYDKATEDERFNKAVKKHRVDLHEALMNR